MTDTTLRALYGLKYNPFLPALPTDALWVPPAVEGFLGRLEALVSQGGFALVTGEPGSGKSKCLELLAARLARLPDVTVGVMERPQSRLADFYRELGELFGVSLTPLNRYGGFKALRARWRAHLETTLFRPVLLIDEAQEVTTDCLTELRLLQSARFDSESLLTTVFSADARLPERFRSPECLPLGSRIRTRLLLAALSPQELVGYLDFALSEAGASHLFTRELVATLAAHAAGNLRLLCHMAAEILAIAASRSSPAPLDEKLFFEAYPPPGRPKPPNPPKVSS
jgi:type II secretory pathway predicted ATPase ExeA